MPDLKRYSLWFVTGSQHLYGPETLEPVAAHSRRIAAGLDAAPALPVAVEFRPALTGPDAIRRLCRQADAKALLTFD